jgi:CRISPR-associated protein Cst1
VLYHLPLEIVHFLRMVQVPTYKDAWNQLVQRGWQLTPVKQGKKGEAGTVEAPKRNYLYEDLFNLPSEAARFIRTYFLRIPQRSKEGDDPRRQYSLRKELNLISWSLVELFLERIVRMEATRIANIRTLGDGLAVYVRRQGGSGKRFFRSFFKEQNAANFRALLIKANIAHIKDGQPTLFDMETYIDVFEEGYEVMRPDWKLARDLVLMRMIDQLKDWLAQNLDATSEEEPEAEMEDALA